MSQEEIVYSASVRQNPLRGSLQLLEEIWNKRQLLVVLLQAGLRQRYKGSYLGVLWTMLNPLMMMLGLAIVFPLIIKFKMENYIVYLFSGIVAWGMISSSVVGGSDSILANQGFLRKVYVPKILFPIISVSVELVNFIVTIVVLHFIALIFGFSISTDVVYLAAATVLTYLFGISLAGITSILVVYFRDLKFMMGNLMQTLFYLSAVIFPVSLLPEKYQFLMEFNIFYQFVRLFHQAIYEPGAGDWAYFTIPLILVASMLTLVVYLHQKLDSQLMYRI